MMVMVKAGWSPNADKTGWGEGGGSFGGVEKAPLSFLVLKNILGKVSPDHLCFSLQGLELISKGFR